QRDRNLAFLGEVGRTPDPQALLTVPCAREHGDALANPLLDLLAEHLFQADTVRLVERELFLGFLEANDALDLRTLIADELLEVHFRDAERDLLALEIGGLEEPTRIKVIPVDRLRKHLLLLCRHAHSSSSAAKSSTCCCS